jgi:hypothetical protein
MLSSTEIARGGGGSVKFLWQDVSAPLHFDNTPEGCLRSFRVMILTAPIYALYLAVHYLSVSVEADEGQIMLAEGLRYVVEWLLYPVIFYEIARRRGWIDRYPRYIAALNWSNLPQMILLLTGVSVAAVAPSAIGAPLLLALQVVFFYWFLMVTRLVLGTDWVSAAVLLVVNYVPSFFLSVLVDRFLGIGHG